MEISRSLKKNSKLLEFIRLEPGLHPLITDIVEAMNTLVRERQNHFESCITVEVSQRTRKVEIYIAKKDLFLQSLVRP